MQRPDRLIFRNIVEGEDIHEDALMNIHIFQVKLDKTCMILADLGKVER